MDKHAYLIAAHNNFYNLQKLLCLLDDKRNDIYIHIDKKAVNFDINSLSSLCKYSTVHLVPRIKVYWGDYSHLENIIQLLERSTANNYMYYHLISGSDLPIKTQDYIHDFCDKNQGKEFVGITTNPLLPRMQRVNRIHLFTKYMRISQKTPQAVLGFIISRPIRDLFLFSQDMVKYKRSKKFEYTFKFGPDWFSISHGLATYIISNKKAIKEMYKFAQYPSESFVQTLIWNSNFKNNIYNVNDEYASCLRYIDWNRGEPYIFRKEDFDEIVNSDKLFARKFDENVDREIIDKIFSYVKNKDMIEQTHSPNLTILV